MSAHFTSLPGASVGKIFLALLTSASVFVMARMWLDRAARGRARRRLSAVVKALRGGEIRGVCVAVAEGRHRFDSVAHVNNSIVAFDMLLVRGKVDTLSEPDWWRIEDSRGFVCRIADPRIAGRRAMKAMKDGLVGRVAVEHLVVVVGDPEFEGGVPAGVCAVEDAYAALAHVWSPPGISDIANWRAISVLAEA